MYKTYPDFVHTQILYIFFFLLSYMFKICTYSDLYKFLTKTYSYFVHSLVSYMFGFCTYILYIMWIYIKLIKISLISLSILSLQRLHDEG